MGGRLIVRILSLACVLQVILTVYFITKIYVSSVFRPDQVRAPEYGQYETDSSDFKMELLQDRDRHDVNEYSSERLYVRGVLSKFDRLVTVDVLGKAAIAQYLWEHILEGTKEVNKNNPSVFTGQLSTTKCVFNYTEGPGLQPKSGLGNRRIVLVSNGRTDEKVAETRRWLDVLGKAPRHPKIVLVLLGNEQCRNEWVEKYVYPKGSVRAVFLTYDDPRTDYESYFQWPLGVATYRQFPALGEDQIALTRPRKYLCNLQATNYGNSSRTPLFEQLKSTVTSLEANCYVRERKRWKSSESVESMTGYVDVLVQSDLTLCPAGFNTETYRVYEALVAGSVPVIEDVPSGGSCDAEVGWRLLKQYSPPVIWVRSWDELPSILLKEKRLSLAQKVARRKRLMNWYEWFKLRTRDRFLSVVETKLLRPD